MMNPCFFDAFRARLEQEKDLAVTPASTTLEALELLNRRVFRCDHLGLLNAQYGRPRPVTRKIGHGEADSIFIVATAKRLTHVAKDALNTGADYYLQKGADMANEVSRLIDFIRTGFAEECRVQLIAWARFYNSIVDSGAELICRIKPDSALSFVNEPCVHLFKKSYRAGARQENFFTYVPDNERPEILPV